jgi:rhamnulokinase
MKNYLAIDLGAESGRLIVGSVGDESFSLKEIYRFPKGMLQLNGQYFWDIGQIFKEILNGLERCVSVEKIVPESIGIDTWGVDYGLLAEDGTLLGMPFTYRDPRTNKAIEEFSRLLRPRYLYNLTGTLIAPYNTIFQLYAAKRAHPRLLQAANDLLFIPDLLAFFLTGQKKTEHSFATTSQLYNPLTREWEQQLFSILDIPTSLMQEVVQPETTIGYLSESVCKQTGMKKIPVIAVATHDTNSAVTAIPAKGSNWAFISSGTWSLMGFESPTPSISNLSFQMNFTNEGGLRNSWHILKNIMGLWPLQECRKCWKNEDYSYTRLTQLAKDAPAFKSFMNIDHEGFLNPIDMPLAIVEYLQRTNQAIPGNHGEFVRIILESLALKYKETLAEIEILKGSSIDELYITGGGIQNEMLCQFAANATGKLTHTGLAEGTAAGNILCQALASGQFHDIDEIKQIIRRSYSSQTYQPENIALWEETYQRYKNLTKR